jgi:copper homeostasis protein CutC
MVLAGGGVTHENVQEIIKQWGVRRLHVGTCVREGKYGKVNRNSLIELRKIVDSL